MKETTVESHYSSTIISRTMDRSNSPALVSPPDTKTLAPAGKRTHLNGKIVNNSERAGSEPIDASALSKALKEFEDGGNITERTLGGSPSRKRQRIYGDRFVFSLSRFRSLDIF